MTQGTLPLQSYFGPYYLQKLIAIGGMAEIYLARTKGVAGFERQLALKVIHPDFADDTSFVNMLVNEAKIAVSLNHPNIAQTFDLGHIGNRYFISMELIDGMDLFQLMKQLSEQGSCLPVPMALFIVHKALCGLEYAHSKSDDEGNPLKIIHRDMSPQNILCSRHGEVKIIDFGIAKAANLTSKTRAGVIKGKLIYMSPEQAWGEAVDHRTDLFSTGIVLYEALTGGSLYLEKNPVKLLEMVRKAEIKPPSHRRREISPELDALVMRALSPRPVDRYQTAREFGSALSDYLTRSAPVLTDQQLGDLVDTVLQMSHLADADLSASKMAREDFAVYEHSIIFAADEMLGSEPLTPKQTPAPGGAGVPPSPPANSLPARRRRARLLLLDEAMAKSYDVNEQFIIGRSGDLRLGDARVSRRHARIFAVDGVHQLEDLGSANGTFLNEEKILEPTLLHSGDIIRVGPFRMRFTVEEDESTAIEETPAPPALDEFSAEKTPLVPLDDAPRPDRKTKAPTTGARPAVNSAVALPRAEHESDELWLLVQLGDEDLRLPVGNGLALAHNLIVVGACLTGETAQLVRHADGLWLEPTAGALPVTINGATVTAPVAVRSGDRLQLGPLAMVVENRR